MRSEELLAAASRRLRALGVRSVPNAQPPPAARPSRLQNGNLFGAPLNSVVMKTVNCCSQSLQVPAVIYDACNLLRTHFSTEGLFRKAGSQARQNEIKRILDLGGKFDKSHHAIDVAAILKFYLRSLPEPILSNDIKQALIKCLLLPENDHSSAIQMTLLFMSTPHQHILHYVMEFFRQVAAKSSINKMDSYNLAVILLPTLTSPQCKYTQELDAHIRLIKFLIENPSIIGTVPSDLDVALEEDQQIEKKKKRRSGSLTRMFTGLRKMVSTNSNKLPNADVMATPVLDKALNKRKVTEQQGFSAKKRKEILENIPNNPNSLTPLVSVARKEHKRLRLSIGKKTKDKYLSEKEKKTSKSDEKKNDFDTKSLDSIDSNNDLFSTNEEYVRISKSEYEAIKSRVSAIEDRISQEFKEISIENKNIEPVMQVQTVYEKTLEEAAMLSSPTSDHLARRLSKELKIRQGDENKIIRSPSARKIGIIRRRSRENGTKLVRTQTWTVSSQQNFISNNLDKNNHFYGSMGLRRGRPNTVNTGLRLPSNEILNKISKEKEKNTGSVESKNVTPVVSPYSTRNHYKRPSSFHGVSDVETPMKLMEERNKKFAEGREGRKWKDGGAFMASLESMDNSLTGRASVAQLRSRMAGTVMAKARLFDGMTDSDCSLDKKINEKQRQSTTFARKSRRAESMSNPVKESNIAISTDFRKLKLNQYKSPGYVSKRHRSRSIKSPTSSVKFQDHQNLSPNLKDVIYEACTPLSEKQMINDKAVKAAKSPRVAPQIKRPLSQKGGILKTNTFNVADMKKNNTPVRANHNMPRRQSPRLVSIKSRQII